MCLCGVPGGEEGSSSHKEPEQEQQDHDESDMPYIVVYMVDPFTYSQEWDDVSRLSQLGLLRCYSEMLQMLPDHLASNIQLQVIPLHSILEFKEMANNQYLKTLCLSVFAQCRRQLSHGVSGRSLTGFGPAASTESLLKSIVKQVSMI